MAYQRHGDREHDEGRGRIGNPHGADRGRNHDSENQAVRRRTHRKQNPKGDSPMQVPTLDSEGSHKSGHQQHHKWMHIGCEYCVERNEFKEGEKKNGKEARRSNRHGFTNPPNGHPYRDSTDLPCRFVHALLGTKNPREDRQKGTCEEGEPITVLVRRLAVESLIVLFLHLCPQNIAMTRIDDMSGFCKMSVKGFS